MSAKKCVFCLLGISFFFLSIAVAEAQDVVRPRTICAVGTVYPLYKSALGSVVSGKVDEVFADVGDSVKKGQPLLKLDESFFIIAVAEAQDAINTAKVEEQDAGRNLDHMKRLFEKREGHAPSISQKRFEDAQTRYEQAAIALQRAEEALKRAQTNLDEATIKAPYDAVITKRFVHPGEPVTATPSTKLLEILSIDELYVEFSVPQLHMSSLSVGTPIQIEIEGVPSVISAALSRIYPDIDEKTRSVKCRACINNMNRTVHPGAFVHVVISLKEAAQ